jgi:hypothetical protein
MPDLTKTLRELEGGPSKPPCSETWPSYLVATCEELYEKPIKDFTTEDLRVMIGQQIGLECGHMAAIFGHFQEVKRGSSRHFLTPSLSMQGRSSPGHSTQGECGNNSVTPLAGLPKIQYKQKRSLDVWLKTEDNLNGRWFRNLLGVWNKSWTTCDYVG